MLPLPGQAAETFAAAGGLQRVPMPDPVVLGVGEPVRKPLRFEQIEPILA